MIKRTVEIKVRLSDEDLVLLKQLAEHLGISMSAVVTMALEHYLNKNNPNPSK